MKARKSTTTDRQPETPATALKNPEILYSIIRSFPGQMQISDTGGAIIASTVNAEERSKGVWREWVTPCADGITVKWSIREF